MDDTHNKLQKSLDNLQKTQDIMTDVVTSLCKRLGDIIGYEFKEKKEYRVYVENCITGGGKKYDFDELIKCADKYIKGGK